MVCVFREIEMVVKRTFGFHVERKKRKLMYVTLRANPWTVSMFIYLFCLIYWTGFLQFIHDCTFNLQLMRCIFLVLQANFGYYCNILLLMFEITAGLSVQNNNLGGNCVGSCNLLLPSVSFQLPSRFFLRVVQVLPLVYTIMMWSHCGCLLFKTHKLSVCGMIWRSLFFASGAI